MRLPVPAGVAATLMAALALPAAAPAPRPLTQADAAVGPCVNMNNHLEAPREGAWGRPIREDDFAAIAARGFRTVRLPVRFAAHAGKGPDFTIDPRFMDRVAHLVTLARTAGLRVIIDMHNDDALVADPLGEAPRLAALWRQVAARFAGADDLVWFELFNEPHGAFDNAKLMTVLGPSLATVRATNPTRPVVIGGEGWSGIDSLATLPLPEDDRYLVATFHYYEPFAFTHQGAGWVDPKPPLGATFGSAADKAQLAASVEKARAYMRRTGRPLLMGEYGAYETVPVRERAAYYGAVSRAFREAGVDGCVWGYVNSFPIRDRKGRWIEPITRALGL
jgi:endoglucanase